MADEKKRRPRGKYGANTAPDGSYVIGKGKPPEHGKFQKGDKRKRGRRSKGTRNLATDFRHEMQDLVTISVNGQPRRVSKQRSLVMRLIDNAGRGQHGALKLALEYGERFGVFSPEDAKQAEPTVAEAYPHMDDLTNEEFRQLEVLLAKASGEELELPPSDPLAYRSDPGDPRNCYTEGTADGLHYKVSMIPGGGRELTGIDSHAYWRAALPRRPGCNRRQY